MNEKIRERKRPIAIDLFCGVGGMSLGFEQAGFDIVLSVDADGHHAAAHERNFPDGVTLCRSVTELDSNAVYEALGGQTEIDLVFGGPPCQGFSHMGLRDDKDPRNTLVDHFARLVSELRPKAFVMENVAGLISGKTKAVLNRTIRVLRAAGYWIPEPARVLDASEFGVPQKRKRLFLLGLRSDLSKLPTYPKGLCPGQPTRPTVWEAIGDLPTVEDHEELFEQNYVKYDKRPTSNYAKVREGSCWILPIFPTRENGIRKSVPAVFVFDTPTKQYRFTPRRNPDMLCPDTNYLA